MSSFRRTRPRVRREQLLAMSDVDRRFFLRGAGLASLGVGVPGLLSACGTEGTQQTAEDCKSTDKSDSEKQVIWSNWVEYIDPIKPKNSTLKTFQRETGINVTYNEDVNDNSDFFSKVQNQLGACEPVGRDMFVLTDWMAARMVGLGWLQQLDKGNIPNVEENLIETLRSPDWDENRDYSVPWQSGFTGIAYNAKYTKEIGSFEELLTRSDLKGKVTLLSEMRDTMSFMLKLEGADPGDFDESEWEQAIERLEEVVSSGQLRSFTGNEYVQGLGSGDIVACEAWSGDVIAMQYDNPDIKWVVPEEGLGIWTDNMLIPNKADHKANAEAVMDYYYDPMNAAKLAAWVNYVCPVDGAQEAMEQVDDTLVDAPLIFPTDDFLAQTTAFMSLDEETARKYETDFSQAMG
jgi:spermidine/putrescine transport system substrate-binding protein